MTTLVHEARFLHALQGIEQSLHIIATRPTSYPNDLLNLIYESTKAMSQALDNLKKEVTETKGAVASILALVEGLAQQIRDNAEDPVALNAMADELDQQQQAIAAAVTANTPPTPKP